MVSRWLYGEHSVLSGAGCSCLCCVDSSTLYRPLLSNTGTVNTVHPNEVKLNFLCSFIQRIHFFFSPNRAYCYIFCSYSPPVFELSLKQLLSPGADMFVLL